MKSGEIYQFDSPEEIFLHSFNQKKQRNPLFSIRAWSRQMGFKNPSHVADVLNKRRNLTVNFGLRVSNFLDLTHEERTYFESLVFLKNAKSEEEAVYFASIVKMLKPEDTKNPISPDKYTQIKDWYYGVVDELVCLSDFKPDPQYLAKRLGPDVTPQAVVSALKDLIALGSLAKSPKGKLSRPKKGYFERNDQPDQLQDSNLRNYHRKFIEKALVALDEQPTGESFFRVTNIPIRMSKFNDYKSHIEDFFQSIIKMENTKDADEVYQVNVQFCRITKKQP